MNKGFLIFGLIGVGAFYFLIGFLHEIEHDPNSKTVREGYIDKKQYKKKDTYIGENNIGEKTLVLKNLSYSDQITIWNESEFKSELIRQFPNFKVMKSYVERTIDSDYLKNKLLDEINYIEGEYISGLMDRETVIKRLGLR